MVRDSLNGLLTGGLLGSPGALITGQFHVGRLQVDVEVYAPPRGARRDEEPGWVYITVTVKGRVTKFERVVTATRAHAVIRWLGRVKTTRAVVITVSKLITSPFTKIRNIVVRLKK